MEMKKESQVLTDAIYDLVKGKLIHQFRKGKWEGIIEEQIKTLVDVSMKAVVISASADTIKECDDRLSTQMKANQRFYKGFISPPKTNLGTRIKFLFLGKF